MKEKMQSIISRFKDLFSRFSSGFELKIKIPALIVAVFGVIHAVYGLVMLSESLIYGVMWLCFSFIELATASYGLVLHQSQPALAKTLLVCLSLWLGLQSVLDAAVLLGSISMNTSSADKVIVLGYQLDEDTASDTLLRRIETAYEYAKDNPESKLIVTGGITGKNTKSEAEVMKSALVSYGVDSLRIYKEEEAKNTIDNMRLSKEFISSQDKVILITSNYHCLRAKVLANKIGYSVKTIGASAPVKLLLNQLFLEKISLLQILLFGI